MKHFRKMPWAVCAALIATGILVSTGIALAQEQPSADQIIEALKPKAKSDRATRALMPSGIEGPSAADRQLIEGLRNRQTRMISIEERNKAAEFASARPNIDLEINFNYNSDVISPDAVPVLVNLGSALRSGDLKGCVFLLSGHTDAKGKDDYNQALSERRADAVKRFLVERFSITPETLIPIGYGKSHLKNPADPFAAENRRVQVVNTEIK
jgi:outer membrane protein OmpA-like peptidoglycan-associated protein